MPQVQQGTFPIAEDVMQLGRATINDMLRNTGGAILTDTAPFTNPFLNAAIRRTQRELANNGLTSNIQDNVILTPVLPTASTDPSVQVFINQNGYFNGVQQLSQPVLPPDLILPLEVWQRQTNSGSQFYRINPAKEALSSIQPGPFFGEWEWRNDALNFVGCSNTMDLRLRYEGSLPRISPSANLSQTTINIRDGEDVLASALVFQYAFSRGAGQRQEAKAVFDYEIAQLINRYVRKDQRIAVRPAGFRAGAGSIDSALSGTYK